MLIEAAAIELLLQFFEGRECWWPVCVIGQGGSEIGFGADCVVEGQAGSAAPEVGLLQVTGGSQCGAGQDNHIVVPPDRIVALVGTKLLPEHPVVQTELACLIIRLGSLRVAAERGQIGANDEL